MGEFMTLEEAAERLGVSETIIRNWIKKGQARASRRGGGYYLRVTEVDRLREQGSPGEPAPAGADGRPASGRLELRRRPSMEAPRVQPLAEARVPEPLSLELDEESGEELAEETRSMGSAEPDEASPSIEDPGAPALLPEASEVPRPKALPPRPREDGARERRRRMGRRQSDFSLEQLSQEVKNAVREVLRDLPAPVSPAPEAEPEPQPPLPDPALQQEVEDLRQRARQLAEENEVLQAQLVEARQEAARRDWEEERADLQARLQDSQSAQQKAVARGAELSLEMQTLRERLRDLESGNADAAERESQVRHLEAAREELRQRLESSEALRLELSREIERLQAAQSEGELRLKTIQAESDSARTQVNIIQAGRGQMEQEIAQLKQQLEAASVAHASSDSERNKWSLENRNLRADLDQARELQARSEESRQILEDQMLHLQAQLEKARQTSGEQQRQLEASALLKEDREQLYQETRRLKEQINSLQYKLQMAGPGGGGPTLEDSRKLMDRLADMEAQMVEKDRLITQSYGELSELRSKLENYQRNFYELQQRYEREKEEWSNVVARQMSDRFSSQQQQPPASQPPPQSQGGRWGLFKPRGDS